MFPTWPAVKANRITRLRCLTCRWDNTGSVLQDNVFVSTIQRDQRRRSRAAWPLPRQRYVTKHAPVDAESDWQPHHRPRRTTHRQRQCHRADTVRRDGTLLLRLGWAKKRCYHLLLSPGCSLTSNPPASQLSVSLWPIFKLFTPKVINVCVIYYPFCIENECPAEVQGALAKLDCVVFCFSLKQ